MFEPEVFRKQTYFIEGSTCDIVGTFPRSPQWLGTPMVIVARVIMPPLPPRYAPAVLLANEAIL